MRFYNKIMKNSYRISFHIYRGILISILPLFLFAKLMVGAAGHNSEIKISDYGFVGFSILTAVLLTAFNQTDHAKSIRKILRSTIIVLVLIGILFLLYGLYDFTMLYFDHHFTLQDNIPVGILLLLIALSATLLIGLLKNKI